MPHEKMPKSKSVGPISVLLLPSPALLLAEGIAEAEEKAPRLAAQQRGRVATRKKGRIRAALRRLRDMGVTLEICRPPLRPHNSRSSDSAALARTGKREGQPRGAVPQLSPEKEAR